MDQNNAKINSDLKTFIEKFQPNKFKVIKGGIEIRGISEIHQHIVQAKALIERMSLKLSINHTAQMVSYGAFEVNVNN